MTAPSALWSTLTAFAAAGAMACGGATGGAIGAGYANVVVERNVEIPMRDGVRLRALVVRPDTEGTFPAVVYRTPYDAEAHLARSAFPLAAAHRGFLVVLVDVRGRHASDGEFDAYRQERQDGFDTIEWAARHPRSSGKVGTYGGSYPGFVQWLALAEGPPHLTTAAPDMTPVGSHHFFHLGGATSYTWFEWFMPLILPDLRRRANDVSGPWNGDSAYTEWVRVRHEWYRYRPLAGVPLLRRYAPYYYDWLTHPDSSAWWAFANVEDAFGTIRAPLLLVSGWFDNTYGTEGAVRGFRGVRREAATVEARAHTRLILGPWSHSSITVHTTRVGELDFGPSAGLDFDALLLRWFDRRLRGIRNGVDRDPPVAFFLMGANRWHTAADWPPPDARLTPLYLTSAGDARTARGNGALTWAPPGAAPPDRYVYDPQDPVWDVHFEAGGPYDRADIETRADVLVYTSLPLQNDVDVAGEIAAVLYVSSDARDTDFAVMLCDVHPDGRSYNVLGPEAGYLRMRYRDGNDRQALLEPGRVYQVTIRHMMTANRFLQGHRIRVHLTSSRAPHFDPNPNTGAPIATETRLVPARQTVFHDTARPSHLLLPVLPPR